MDAEVQGIVLEAATAIVGGLVRVFPQAPPTILYDTESATVLYESL